MTHKTGLPLFDAPVERVRRGQARARLASDRAARVIDPEWTETAINLARVFGLLTGGAWLMEDARRYAEEVGLPAPPDKRAWGTVATELRRRGVIRADGFGVDSTGAPKTQWRLAI